MDKVDHAWQVNSVVCHHLHSSLISFYFLCKSQFAGFSYRRSRVFFVILWILSPLSTFAFPHPDPRQLPQGLHPPKHFPKSILIYPALLFLHTVWTRSLSINLVVYCCPYLPLGCKFYYHSILSLSQCLIANWCTIAAFIMFIIVLYCILFICSAVHL